MKTKSNDLGWHVMAIVVQTGMFYLGCWIVPDQSPVIDPLLALGFFFGVLSQKVTNL